MRGLIVTTILVTLFTCIPEHVLGDYQLADNFDPLDDDFNGDLPVGKYVLPYASAAVDQDGDYAFGYIPAGNYVVAFTCNAGR